MLSPKVKHRNFPPPTKPWKLTFKNYFYMKKTIYVPNVKEEHINLAKQDVVNAFKAFIPFYEEECNKKREAIKQLRWNETEVQWLHRFLIPELGYEERSILDMYLMVPYTYGKSYYFKDIDLNFKGSNALVLAIMLKYLNSLNLDPYMNWAIIHSIILSRFEMMHETVRPLKFVDIKNEDGSMKHKIYEENKEKERPAFSDLVRGEFEFNTNKKTIEELKVIGIKDMIKPYCLKIIEFMNCSNVVEYPDTETGKLIEIIHKLMQITADVIKSFSTMKEVEFNEYKIKSVNETLEDKPIKVEQAVNEDTRNEVNEDNYPVLQKCLDKINSGVLDKELKHIYEKLVDKTILTNEDFKYLRDNLNYIEFYNIAKGKYKLWLSWVYDKIKRHFKHEEENVVSEGISNVIEEF